MKKHALAIDAVALAAFLVACNPHLTGVGFHEWMGLGVLVVLVVHCTMHADRIARSFRSMAKNPTGVAIGRMALNVLTFLSLVVCCVSGLCESGTVLKSFGVFMGGYYFWNPIHAVSAKMMLALVVAHLAINARQVVASVKKRRDRDHA